MQKHRSIALVAVGVIAGLIVGSLGIASAATKAASTSSTSTSQNAGPGFGRHGGFEGGPGMGGRGFGRGAGGGDLASTVASLTGISVKDVMTERQAGKSFAAIAKTKDVTTEQIVSKALANAKTMFDAMVKVGRMTSAEKTQALSDLKTRLETEVASTAAMQGPGDGRGGRGMHPGRGFGDDALASSVASLTSSSLQDVMTQRQAGKSFSAIAEAKGVSASDVIAKALANIKSMLQTEMDSTSTAGPGRSW